MDNKNPKLRKNGGKGTLFGNLLRGVVGIGKVLSPNLIGAITNATGIGDIPLVKNLIDLETGLTKEDKDVLFKEIDKDIKLEQELTKRWELDTNSSDWLPRNIRPLVVANFTILIDFVLIASQFGRPIAEAYLPILMTMGVTAIGGYFTLREYGKSKK